MRGKASFASRLLCVVFLLMFACTAAADGVIYVDANAAGANNGSSWEDAYVYLQDALADANAADKPVEIRVAQGIYKPDQGVIQTPGDREATFQLINNVTLTGGYAGLWQPDPNDRDIILYETILSGDLIGDDIDVYNIVALSDEPKYSDNSYHVVVARETDNTAVLDGFTITAGNANGPILDGRYPESYNLQHGAGMYSVSGSPTLTNCTFSGNLADSGGGMYNYENNPTLTDCSFSENAAAASGAGMFNYTSNPIMTNCNFSENRAKKGGGMYNYYESCPILTNCTFSDNTVGGIEYGYGGGMFNNHSDPVLNKCTFSENFSNHDGGGMRNFGSDPTLANCIFIRNSAGGGGGMINGSSNPILTNCMFIGNVSRNGGGGIENQNSDPLLTKCIFSGNQAKYGGGMYNGNSDSTLINCLFSGNEAETAGGGIYIYPNSDITIINSTFAGNLAINGDTLGCESTESRNPSDIVISNCIFWNSSNEIWNNDNSIITVNYSNIRGGWPGQGNINTDPLFVDADGADNIVGTEDDDLRLSPDSPCIDAGDNSEVPQSVVMDFGGNPRIVNGTVDMGAYEVIPNPNVYYVDAVSGNDNSDGLTPEAAFATIQRGIDTAEDGDVVLVYPGLYLGEINFMGKALTVQGVVVSPAGVPVLWNPGDFAVSFYSGEGPGSILKNFIIRDSFMGIFIVDSSPAISNLTIADNTYGIEAYADSEPIISNTILWNNTDGDLFGCRAMYSCVERGGEGNITADPLFVDPDNDDYHIRSERGRYWPEHDIWVLDKVTSPCVDGGNPEAQAINEPMPNGGRINIGAYGGTLEASLSPGEQPTPVPRKASNPYPADGAVNVDRDVVLNWTAGFNAVSHDVYFGTEFDHVSPSTVDNVLVGQIQTGTNFDPGRLYYNQTYYWRIDEVDSDGRIITGDVWMFTTTAGLVSLPRPTSG